MFALIGNLFSMAFGLVKAGLSLAVGAAEFVLGILGGVFSLLLSLGGFLLAGALVLVAIFRRRAYKQKHEERRQEEHVYDVDSEEFTSFYDQFREQG